MALFGKKEKQGEVQQELDMLVATTENIGRPYEVIGLVTNKITKSEFDQDIIAKELMRKAHEIGADAIIGFKFETTSTMNLTTVIAYGTAVKFK